jgi:hypothetical protein
MHGAMIHTYNPRMPVMGVEVNTTRGVAASTPRVVVPNAGAFDFDPIGERFLVLTQKERDRLPLITNWDDLTRRLPRP